MRRDTAFVFCHIAYIEKGLPARKGYANNSTLVLCVCVCVDWASISVAFSIIFLELLLHELNIVNHINSRRVEFQR